MSYFIFILELLDKNYSNYFLYRHMKNNYEIKKKTHNANESLKKKFNIFCNAP